jgi:glycosyltransferase involved in cell wall biosynthesis
VHIQRTFDVLDAPELFADSLFVSIRRNVPHVIRLLTPHAKFIADQLHNIDKSLDHELVAVLERVAMYSADVITSPSHDLAQWVANDLNYPVERMMIVRDPIDCKLFNPEGTRAFEASDKIKVLFVGRLEERKGVHYIVDAIPDVVSRNKNVHFYFLGADTNTGPCGSSVLDELKRRLAATNQMGAVTFIPVVAHVKVPEYMRSADICLVPSLYDNSPFTCIEAMASGKPVIGSDAGGTPEYVIDGKVGLIVPARDAKALAGAILELANDTEKRLRFGAAARQWAESQYAREIIAAETLEVYRAAQRKFAASGGRDARSLNMYEREEFVHRSDGMTNSLDLAFHDLRLKWSLSYRVRTLIRKTYIETIEFGKLARQRPKLAAARLALGIFQPLVRLVWSGRAARPSKTNWLENEIRAKQSSPQSRPEVQSTAKNSGSS